jgi:hypothetical protein
MFHAAFASLSASNPQAGQEFSRTHNGFSVETPQCGQPDIPVSITEKNTVHGHCPACKKTIFWNDTEVFEPLSPRNVWDFLDERDVRKRKTKNGDTEKWYPMNKVRVYEIDR